MYNFFGENDGKIYFIKNKNKIYVTEEEKEKLLLGYIFNENGELEKTNEVIEKEKEIKLNNLKNQVAGKIYGKYSKETQTTLLYTAFFTFANRLLEIESIKSEFTSEELEILKQAKNVFLDMQEIIKKDYEIEKENILKD